MQLTNKRTTTGFTIVELLIVIVVIAILAAISLVAYNGIQDRARVASLQSDLAQAAKQLEVYKVGVNASNLYPVDQSAAIAAGLKFSTGTTYTYYYNSSNNNYCLQAVNNGVTYSVSSLAVTPQLGDCTTNGLVGWWDFNGNANDISGSGNDGIVNGATLTTGQNGQANGAYSFDGVDDHITIPSQLPSSTEQFSISLWAKAVTGTGSDTYWGYLIHRSNNTSVGASVFTVATTGTGTQWYTASANGNFTTGQTTIATSTTSWRLITLVYDGSAQTVYVDGTQNRYAVIGAITNNTTGTTTGIGSTPLNPGYRTVSGSIDDVRIYDRALSASEVGALYSAGAQ